MKIVEGKEAVRDQDSVASHMGLSSRAVNALKWAGIQTIGDLRKLPVGEIRLIKGIGHKGAEEILLALGVLSKPAPEPGYYERLRDQALIALVAAYRTTEEGCNAPAKDVVGWALSDADVILEQARTRKVEP